MAVRQYIGARYVTKIYENSVDPSSAEWEENVNYEPLTLVTYNNGSYLSKKEVPASVGNPAVNSSYWVQTGFYNGQIASLQNQIDTINNTDLPAIQGEIDTINDTSLPALQSQIDSLEDLSKRKILVIGNSYVYFGVAHKLEALFNASYENTESATGFIAYADTNKNFVMQLENTIADTDIPHDEITDILFVSAMGDCRAYSASTSTYLSRLNTAMQTIMTDIAASYTNCKRVMLTLAETRDKPSFNDNPYNSLFAVHKIFKKACFINGIDYLGFAGFNALFNSNYVQSDHYHPSSAGNDVIGEWIKNAYLGSISYDTLVHRKGIDCNYTADGSITCHVELTPDICNIRLGNMSVTNGENVTLAANSSLLETADLNVPAPAPIPNFSICTHVTRVRAAQDDDNVLFIGFENDGNGCLKLYNFFAPANATTG